MRARPGREALPLLSAAVGHPRLIKDEATMRRLAFAQSDRLPFTWHDSERVDDPSAAALVEGLDEASLPLVTLPEGVEQRGPTAAQLSRALGIGRELGPREPRRPARS